MLENLDKLELQGKVGLYLHIPFCRRICPYCDFTVLVSKDKNDKQIYAKALTSELNFYSKFDIEVETVYFGGGTPSSAPRVLESVLEEIFKNFRLAPDLEISIEANPEDHSDAEFISLLQNIKPRLSIGAQSMDEWVLKTLGRNHTPKDVLALIDRAMGSGVTNINVDIIFGVPSSLRRATVTNQRSHTRRIEQEIEQIVTLVKHVSCYLLTIEAGSHFFETGVKERIREKEVEAIFNVMDKHGFEWYEISNFALKGYKCRHNLKYWRLENTLGLGLGSVSFINSPKGAIRIFNTKDMKTYLNGKRTAFVETLSELELSRERLILGLRSHLGIDYAAFKDNPKVETLISQGLLRLTSGKLYLTRNAFSQSNNVISYLLATLEPRDSFTSFC